MSEHTRVGIVGGGFGALMVYVVLRFRGLAPADIRVFTADPLPASSWARFVSAISLHELRSESVGHFYPTDAPGLATVEAFRTWSVKPLVLSWFDRFHPSVEVFLKHVAAIAQQTAFGSSVVSANVGRVVREEDTFTIFDPSDTPLGTVQHLILAVGHGRLRVPAAVSAFRDVYPGDSRVVHAFEEKSYGSSRRVLVLGNGHTAGTEWVNILEAGGEVVALSRDGFVFGQPLNTPRRYFSRRGLAPYRQREDAARLEELTRVTRGTIPSHPAWMRLFHGARRAGQLHLLRGELLSIDVADPRTKSPLATGAGHDAGALRCTIRLPDGVSVRTILVHQIIAATGFEPASAHPLLARLTAEYHLSHVGGYVKLRDDCCIDELSTPTSIAAIVGPAAAWALPCADSLGGMRIVAHELANRILGAESWHPRELFQRTRRWATLVTGKDFP